jgi:hypothetical protein
MSVFNSSSSALFEGVFGNNRGILHTSVSLPRPFLVEVYPEWTQQLGNPLLQEQNQNFRISIQCKLGSSGLALANIQAPDRPSIPQDLRPAFIKSFLGDTSVLY